MQDLANIVLLFQKRFVELLKDESIPLATRLPFAIQLLPFEWGIESLSLLNAALTLIPADHSTFTEIQSKKLTAYYAKESIPLPDGGWEVPEVESLENRAMLST